MSLVEGGLVESGQHTGSFSIRGERGESQAGSRVFMIVLRGRLFSGPQGMEGALFHGVAVLLPRCDCFGDTPPRMQDEANSRNR